MKSQGMASDVGLLVLRLVLGAVFIGHGAQKLFGAFGGSGMERFIDYLGGIGVPVPTLSGWLAAIAEFGGGILVAIGLFPRIASFALAGTMAVAILKVHLHNGFFMNHMNTPDKGHGMEFSLALLAMALAVAFVGAGGISVEKALQSRGGSKEGP